MDNEPSFLLTDDSGSRVIRRSDAPHLFDENDIGNIDLYEPVEGDGQIYDEDSADVVDPVQLERVRSPTQRQIDIDTLSGMTLKKPKSKKKENKLNDDDDEDNSVTEPKDRYLLSHIHTRDSHLDTFESDVEAISDSDIDEYVSRYPNKNLVLRDYQKRVIKFMNNNTRCLVIHGTGAGKTLTAAISAQMFLDRDRKNNRIVLVTHPILINNFYKGLEQLGVNSRYVEDHYMCYSFDSFRNKYKDIEDLDKIMLIVDEAHVLRNQTARSRAVTLFSYNVAKVMLLTATPFVNRLEDFVVHMNILKGEDYYRHKKHSKSLLKEHSSLVPIMNDDPKSIRFLFQELSGKTDYHNVSEDTNFPTRSDVFLKIKSTPQYYNQYLKALNNVRVLDTIYNKPSAFYYGYRQAVNAIGSNNPQNSYYSQKLKAVLRLIKEGNQKTLIYSNWITYGIESLETILKKERIVFESIKGSTTELNRIKAIERFNKRSSGVQVLLISSVGGHGIDLKRTRKVIILDPPWNSAAIEQIAGRAIRYKSHDKLPPDERNVTIYHLCFIPPDTEQSSEGYHRGGDHLLYKIIKKKYIQSKNVDKHILEKLQLVSEDA